MIRARFKSTLAALAISLCARPARAHAPQAGDDMAGWFWLLLTGALLLAGALAYAIGLKKLWHRARNHGGIDRWRATAFAIAWLASALALTSPLDSWSEELFVAHMIQHEILMLIAAPLFIFSRPAVVLLWALPQRPRKALGRLAASTSWRGLWRFFSHPATAWLIYASTLWGWHAPPLFAAALENEAVHVLQHTSFLGAALLFWWRFLQPGSQKSLRGVAVFANFTTAVHASILAAAFTFSQTAWYAPYLATTHHWGLTALEDQQLGGLVMWIPGGIVHALAAVLALAPLVTGATNRPTPIPNSGRS